MSASTEAARAVGHEGDRRRAAKGDLHRRGVIVRAAHGREFVQHFVVLGRQPIEVIAHRLARLGQLLDRAADIGRRVLDAVRTAGLLRPLAALPLDAHGAPLRMDGLQADREARQGCTCRHQPLGQRVDEFGRVGDQTALANQPIDHRLEVPVVRGVRGLLRRRDDGQVAVKAISHGHTTILVAAATFQAAEAATAISCAAGSRRKRPPLGWLWRRLSVSNRPVLGEPKWPPRPPRQEPRMSTSPSPS